jgi:hypothetical protein
MSADERLEQVRLLRQQGHSPNGARKKQASRPSGGMARAWSVGRDMGDGVDDYLEVQKIR